jgi:hypothetical protein
VGSTTIAPGESTTVTVSMLMHKGMGGMHLFEVTVNSNDPAPAADKVSLRANYIDS